MAKPKSKGLTILRKKIIKDSLSSKSQKVVKSDVKNTNKNNKNKNLKKNISLLSNNNNNTNNNNNFNNNDANKNKNKNSLIPFEKTDNILLVGEGDFSFATSIIQEHLCENSITATTLDSEEESILKYEDTKPNIEFLRESGSTVLFNIDATKLQKYKKIFKLSFSCKNEDPDKYIISNDDNARLNENPYNNGTSNKYSNKSIKGKIKLKGNKKIYTPFNCIIFNFPHIGNSVSSQDYNIRQHQKLMLDFFESASQMLPKDTGTIVVTLFEGLPYSEWNIVQLAKKVGLYVKRTGIFNWDLFPSYHHRRTAGMGDTNKSAINRKARIHIFSLSDSNKSNFQSKDSDSDSE